MKKLIAVSMFLFFNNLSYAQVNLKKEKLSKVVFFKELELKKTLNEIITKKNPCKKEGKYWYVEFMKNDLIMITQGRSIENLLPVTGINNIYTTFIDDKIVFILSDENIFKNTGFSVDLGEFVGKINHSIIDSSFWVIRKTNKKKYQIVKEKIYRCDN
jgi:hypothetical protein